MGGKASEGSDYTLSTAGHQVTIPAGQTSGSVTLSALIDSKKEKKETAVMTLQSGSGYEFAKTGKRNKKSKAPSATVVIVD